MIFKINLATRVYINTRLLKLCTIAAVVLLVSLLFVNVSTIASRTVEMKNLAKQIAVMDEKLKTINKGVSAKEYNALLSRINFANALIEKKTYNWLALLDNLEIVVPDGVAISSIEPDPRGQALKLAGVARSFKNLRVFLEHLEDSKFFTDVYLASQGDAKLTDNSQVISFNLTCRVLNK